MKGPSWLCCIPEYNFIKGMSVDYMHCILLGITRLLLRLWMQSTYYQELWYIGTQIGIVDSDFAISSHQMKFSVPHEVLN